MAWEPIQLYWHTVSRYSVLIQSDAHMHICMKILSVIHLYFQGVSVYRGQWSHKSQTASCASLGQEYDSQLGKVGLTSSAICFYLLNLYVQLLCLSACIASPGARKALQCCFSPRQGKLSSPSLQFLASHQQG